MKKTLVISAVLVVVMAIVVGFGIGLGQVQAQTGWAQVTMQNNTPFTLDLYVGNDYGCRALSGMFCTTQVRAGSHMLTAKASNGLSTTDGPYHLKSGDSLTWTVTYEEQ